MRLPHSPRASLAVALVLTVTGIVRVVSDFLADVDPGWARVLDGTPWRWTRYLLRTSSDGTFLGELNVQWFKVLAVPCAIAGLWLVKRITARDLADADRLWRTPAYRAAFVVLFAAMCLVAELEKNHHWLGLRMSGQLAGESAAWNHVAHAGSVGLGAWLMTWLCFVAPRAPVPTTGDTPDAPASPPRTSRGTSP